MAQKPETRFRTGRVDPFLKTLKNCVAFSIQQVALVGHPDKLLCIRGRFVALELKAAGGKATPMQEHYLAKIRAAGGIAHVVSPDNWEEVKAILRKIDEDLP